MRGQGRAGIGNSSVQHISRVWPAFLATLSTSALHCTVGEVRGARRGAGAGRSPVAIANLLAVRAAASPPPLASLPGVICVSWPPLTATP
eukprot:334816-Prorocentrum_minimum.AAC.1